MGGYDGTLGKSWAYKDWNSVGLGMDWPGGSEGILYEMRQRDFEYAVAQRLGVKSTESCSLIAARWRAWLVRVSVPNMIKRSWKCILAWK